MMSDFNGDDLLKVFKELDVQLFHLNPNVVKAWFDTDDKDLKSLLNWMCVSLSKENFISPLAVKEYKAIETPLSSEELEIEKQVLQTKYPGIFDVEYNLLEIEFLEEDLNLAQQQEKELNRAIEMNKKFEEKLTEDLTQKVKEEIESSVKLQTTEEKCLVESQQLDEMNKKIHDQLLKYMKVLQDFQFSPSPMFINNFDIGIYEEKIENILYTLKPMLEKLPQIDGNLTNLNTMPTDDSTGDDLSKMHYRISHSQHQCLATTIEVEKLKAIISYLEETNIDSLLSRDDDYSSLKESIAMKKETKTKLADMLEDSVKLFADHHIAEARLTYLEQELEVHREHLNQLTELEGMIQKMVSHYSVLRIMYDQERKDIEDFETYFKKIVNYVNRDMRSCVIRTEKMKEIIEDYNNSSSEETLKIAKTIVKMLSNNETNFTISRACELLSNFHREIDFLEAKLFAPGFGDVKAQGKELRNSINVLQSFLVSGPTHRVVLVPTALQRLIRQVEERSKKELESIKSSIEIVSSAKKGTTKWQNYKRKLWMYFYADHSRLKLILQEIQDEFEKTKVNKTTLKLR